MTYPNTIKTNKFKTHNRICAALFVACLAAAAVGVLDLLGAI